jgi:hypothetical protein
MGADQVYVEKLRECWYTSSPQNQKGVLNSFLKITKVVMTIPQKISVLTGVSTKKCANSRKIKTSIAPP